MRRAQLTLVAVTLSWGYVPVIVVRLEELPGLAIAAARVAIAAVGLGLVIALRHWRGLDKAVPRPWSHRPVAACTTGALLAVHWAALFAAYQRAPISTVILIVYLAPVGVAAVAPWALDEHHGTWTLVALAVAVAGLALVVGPGARDAGASGLALAALAAVTFVALVVVSKPLAQFYGGLRTAFIEFSGAAILLVPFAWSARWSALSATEWRSLLVLGLFHTGLLVAAYLGALARVPATHVGILGYLEPVSAVVLSWHFLEQGIALTTLMGGGLIVAAGVVVVRSASSVPLPEVSARAPG